MLRVSKVALYVYLVCENLVLEIMTVLWEVKTLACFTAGVGDPGNDANASTQDASMQEENDAKIDKSTVSLSKITFGSMHLVAFE